MTKIVSAIGLCLGLFVLTMAYFTAPGSVEARESDCTVKEIALDEGYGVTRTEIRAICARR